MSEIPDREYFKLSEVCKLANVQPYMLRFWATQFPGIEASKTDTGQRVYSKQQVELILEIRRLLFEEGLTVAGAKKRLQQWPPTKKTKKAPPPPTKPQEKKAATTGIDKAGDGSVALDVERLRKVRRELAAILADLKKLVGT